MTDSTGLPKLAVGRTSEGRTELWQTIDGRTFTVGYVDDDIAAEIVRRCNAFDGLVEALKALNHYVHRETLVEIQDQVDAALADAEKA